MRSIDTLVIGAGQAGLATSWCLNQRGREHLVLEQAKRPADAWRSERWDSFCLVTPNWSVRMPGATPNADPNGFLPRDDLVAFFERYAESFQLPVQYETQVSSVEALESGFRVKTQDETWQARNVVVATGLFQQPRIPDFQSQFPGDILQLASGRYRRPELLPAGAVLVVGSAQSGCQIAEELYQSGRKVYLCTGSAGRLPRRYRGRDIFEWAELTGFTGRTADKLPSPRARFAANPHLSGKNGGHTLNLHRFWLEGVTLLGRLQDVQHGRLVLAPDLQANLHMADELEAEFLKMIDAYIAANRVDAPEEQLPRLADAYQASEILSLDLRQAGITTVIWALGYTFDFSLVRLPVFDADGFPVTTRGATGIPGLYFVGLPWLSAQKSGLILGVGEDAEAIARSISQPSARGR